MLRACRQPLVAQYDLLLLDLDGVVYLGDQAVPGAVAALSEVRSYGTGVHFVTNNAARRADAVVDRLHGLGVAAQNAEVTTSAQGAGAALAVRWAPDSVVLVVGADALAQEIADAGLRPTRSAEDKPVAVVQGYSPDVGWAQLAEAMVAIRRGARWVATNLDATLPSPRGPVPGNGSLVGALATALDRRPDLVVGKPEPDLFHQAVRVRAASHPLVVGDRLDTDIEGAVRADMPSLLVLTGVTAPADLLAAPERMRPSYLAEDLHGLLEPHPSPTVDGAITYCGGWRVEVGSDDTLNLSGSGTSLDALRATCAVAWAADRTRHVRAGSEAAEAIVADWF